MTDDLEHLAKRSRTLSLQIQPLLMGQGPDVQGAVLADLVATFFAGCHPDLREGAIEMWIETMRKLIAPSVDELREKGRLPPGWSQ
jgi:hypothetical protein